jgi:hypothetical protein
MAGWRWQREWPTRNWPSGTCLCREVPSSCRHRPGPPHRWPDQKPVRPRGVVTLTVLPRGDSHPGRRRGPAGSCRRACTRPPLLGGGGDRLYGAGLASFLAAQGEWVVEIDRPKRPRGRNGAKSDALDAIRAGREALGREHLATPRQRGHREALRVLQLARSGAVKVAADARRQLKALLVTAPEPLRQALQRGTWLAQARVCAALQPEPAAPVEDRATVRAANDRPAGPAGARRGRAA